MKFLAHRGVWTCDEEKNTRLAMEMARDLSLGLETDIRDYCGRLVISHDVPQDPTLCLDESLIGLFSQMSYVALNIKCDGLVKLIKASALIGLDNWAAFDMSVPQTLQYRAEGLPYLVRCSEFESLNDLYEDSSGVWLDSFNGELLRAPLEKVLRDNKIVCLVSPELHGHCLADFWEELSGYKSHENIYLCTDDAEQAVVYFG